MAQEQESLRARLQVEEQDREKRRRESLEVAHRATINRGKTWDEVTTFMYIYMYNRCIHTMSQVGEVSSAPHIRCQHSRALHEKLWANNTHSCDGSHRQGLSSYTDLVRCSSSLSSDRSSLWRSWETDRRSSVSSWQVWHLRWVLPRACSGDKFNIVQWHRSIFYFAQIAPELPHLQQVKSLRKVLNLGVELSQLPSPLTGYYLDVRVLTTTVLLSLVSVSCNVRCNYVWTYTCILYAAEE